MLLNIKLAACAINLLIVNKTGKHATEKPVISIGDLHLRGFVNETHYICAEK